MTAEANRARSPRHQRKGTKAAPEHGVYGRVVTPHYPEVKGRRGHGGRNLFMNWVFVIVGAVIVLKLLAALV